VTGVSRKVDRRDPQIADDGVPEAMRLSAKLGQFGSTSHLSRARRALDTLDLSIINYKK
jgi:hypothetical protein